MTLTRRRFLHGSAVGAAALGLPASAWASVLGANGDVRIAVVGLNGRGKDHINGFHKLPGVRVVALCDPDRRLLDAQAQKFAKRGEKVAAYVDIRKLLDASDVDAIAVATPNHWHALMAIWGCQAGVDVYLEKPVSHSVWEGRKIVEAARKYDRIVATGTQSRSNPGLREAVEFVQNGGLGRIVVVRGLCYKRRKSIGKVHGPQPVPDHIDYDLWTGPARLGPLMRGRLHYDWHWVWNTGNGDVGNQGIHQMDMARWILQADALSPRVLSVGGRLGYDDDGETPNTQVVMHDYPTAPLIFEVRGLPDKADGKAMDKYRGASIGVVAECENGYLSITGYDGGTAYDNGGGVIKKFKKGADHYANFIAAMRSRAHTDLTADIEDGHLSSALCHTGNISHLVGAASTQGEIRDRLRESVQLGNSLARMFEHLGENGIDVATTKFTLGAALEMDPATEQFTNHDAANRLLRRDYRAPYVVPDVV